MKNMVIDLGKRIMSLNKVKLVQNKLSVISSEASQVKE